MPVIWLATPIPLLHVRDLDHYERDACTLAGPFPAVLDAEDSSGWEMVHLIYRSGLQSAAGDWASPQMMDEQERARLEAELARFRDLLADPHLDEQERAKIRAKLSAEGCRLLKLLGESHLDEQERATISRVSWQVWKLHSLALPAPMNERERAEAGAEVQQAIAEGRAAFAVTAYWRAPEIVEAVVHGREGNDFWWVGEAAVYDVEGEGPVLYLTSREQSPILMHPAEAAVALSEDKAFPLTEPDELRAIKAHPTTVRVVMAELNLEDSRDCCWPLTPVAERRLPKSGEFMTLHPHFHIEAEAGAPPLNPAQRRLAEALFGKPLNRYLDWLRGRGVYQTRVMTESEGGVAAFHDTHGPFAVGVRFSALGDWDFLLSCNSILRDVYEARGRTQDPSYRRSSPFPSQAVSIRPSWSRSAD